MPPGELRAYAQGLRGARYRWWRPLVAVVVAAAAFLGVALALLVSLVVAGLIAGGGLDQSQAWLSGLAGEKGFTAVDLLITNLVLAGMIPIAILAVWAGHRAKPGILASVDGRLRWGWLLRAFLVAAGVLGVITVGISMLDPGGFASPEKDWLVLSVIVVLTTPLQTAGEEFLFRGWLNQAVGSWFRRPAIASVAGALVSSFLFGLAHGTQDHWLFADRFCFGLVASWLTYRTGGLEAGIAVHTVNNVVAFGLAISTGALSATMLVTSEPPIQFVMALILLLVTAWALDAAARRSHLQRWLIPAGFGPGGPGAPGGPAPLTVTGEERDDGDQGPAAGH